MLQRGRDFKAALRKYIPPGALSEERFRFLSAAAEEAWAEMVPKPKAQSVKDVLLNAFSETSQLGGFVDYILMIQDDAALKALEAVATPECAQQYRAVQTSLFALSESDGDFCDVARSIFASLEPSSATQGFEAPLEDSTRSSPPVAPDTSSSSPERGMEWLQVCLQHDCLLISEGNRNRCGSLASLLLQ